MPTWMRFFCAMGLATAQTSSMAFASGNLSGMQLHLAGLDFGQVEHVVDELKKMASAVEDVAEIFLLLRIERAGLAVHQEIRRSR